MLTGVRPPLIIYGVDFMKANQFTSSEMGDMNMINAAMYLVVLLVVLYVGVNIIQGVGDATELEASVASTGTLSITGASAVNNVVNISTETYTFTNGTSGAFDVDVGSDAGNASYSTSQLVAEITANSTLVTAVDNTDNSTTVTSVITGTTGNAYGTTENVTNAAWGSTTLTGGLAEDSLYQTSTDMDNTTEDAYGMASIMPIVMIAVAVLGGLLGVLYLFR